jgi:hypothetical protein
MRVEGTQTDVSAPTGALALCVTAMTTEAYVLYLGRVCLTSKHFWRVLS